MIFKNLPDELKLEVISYIEKKCISCKKKLIPRKDYFSSNKKYNKYTFCSTRCVNYYFFQMNSYCF